MADSSLTTGVTDSLARDDGATGDSLPNPARPRAEYEPGGLADNPLWPDFLAELAANRQADREQAEREYAQGLPKGEASNGAAVPYRADEDDRPQDHPLWQALLDEIAARRRADLERDAREYAE